MDKNAFRDLMRDPVSRRHFLSAAGMTTGLLLANSIASAADSNNSAVLPSFPFTLGVASGDPTPDGVVLWTRLAPKPTEGGWDSTRSRAVRWQVAADPYFGTIVQQGAILALPQEGHSIHVELKGLKPSTYYWYRFIVDNYTSRTGRTRTAPAAGTPTNQVKFAFCSCSDFQNGYFTAYKRMAEEDIDFWVHLGDYIYEYDPRADAVGGRKHTQTVAYSSGNGLDQLSTLADYRNRHAQYKTDAALQELHANHPMIAIWDDHEVENNYATDLDEIGDAYEAANGGNPLKYQAPAQFLMERAAAYQAYYEHMPIRRGFVVLDGSGQPQWKDANLFRRLKFGNLVTLHLLDTRQYRTDQPVDTSNPLAAGLALSDFRPTLPTNGNPTGTLLGSPQKSWLKSGIADSETRWNVVGNQVMVAQFNFNGANFPIPVAPGVNVATPVFNVDQWDGYSAERSELLQFIGERTAKNVVVLTGDIHSAWAHDLRTDWSKASTTVATEFICSSVTADFPTGFWPLVQYGAPTQPWTKFVEPTKRGYVVCTATPDTFRADFRAVTSDPTTGQAKNPNGTVSTVKSFVVANGVPGAQAA